MTALRLPWIQLAILLPLLGAAWIRLAGRGPRARSIALVASGLAFLCGLGCWLDFHMRSADLASERWDLAAMVLGYPVLAVDELSAPLLPLGSLIFFLTVLATLRTKLREFSFRRCLISESILLATLGCQLPWGIILLLAAGTLPPFFELRKARHPTRVYALHMGVFIVLMVLGQALSVAHGTAGGASFPAVLLLTAAMLVRGGVVPAHCWMTDLFEHATFGTALLTITPMIGVYGLVRLVFPVAPEGVLRVISLISLLTATYASGMALVQRDARRFFCYLLLSSSSLVLVGIETANPIGLTGALSLWLSVGLSLTGFGLTLRCLESRTGRLSLATFNGLYQQVPTLAALFLLTGLASIGFPGTIGFIGLELLVEGVVQASPLVGACVVVIAALNGLGIMHAYFRIFAGTPHVTSIDLMIRLVERIAVLVLTVLILGGGLFPQPGITFCHRAAVRLVRSRTSVGEATSPAASHARLPARTRSFAPAARASRPLAEAGIVARSGV